jgi:hypothetical protein
MKTVPISYIEKFTFAYQNNIRSMNSLKGIFLVLSIFIVNSVGNTPTEKHEHALKQIYLLNLPILLNLAAISCLVHIHVYAYDCIIFAFV